MSRQRTHDGSGQKPFFDSEHHNEQKSYNYEERDGRLDIPEEDILREPEAQYNYHRQGEYTLEDYYALPDDQRVELIDGVFYVMEAPTVTHQYGLSDVWMQLYNYIDAQNGTCQVFHAPVDVQLDCDDRTMVEPDILVVCDWDKIFNRCIYGAPDLVMEVLSPSTSRKDQTIKVKKYQNAGVREYWTIDIKKERVVVYDFANDRAPAIYGIDQPVPVQIFDEKCRISFDSEYSGHF